MKVVLEIPIPSTTLTLREGNLKIRSKTTRARAQTRLHTTNFHGIIFKYNQTAFTADMKIKPIKASNYDEINFGKEVM